jgi:tetratricopeptide (TPR) repeat protein
VQELDQKFKKSARGSRIKTRISAALFLCGLAVLHLKAFAASTSPGCTSSDPTYNGFIQRGQEAKEAGKWRESVEDFQRALQLEPGCALIRTELGGLYYTQKDYARALSYFEDELAIDPQDFYAAKFGGISAYWLNKYAKAIDLLVRAKTIRENDARVYYWLGECYFTTGNLPKALAELNFAQGYDPRDIEILYLLGKIHWQLSQQAWDSMEKIDPASYRVEQMMAESYVASGRYPDAVKEYETIIKQKPHMPGFHEALGKVYLRIRDLPNAERQFHEELNVDPHSYPSYCELAEVMFRRQNLPAALNDAKKAIAERPDYGEGYEVLGKIYLQLGRKREALGALEQAARLLPSEPSPYYMLAQVYAESGQAELAKQARKRYQDLVAAEKKESLSGRQ